nr:collagenase family protein [uncultured Mediterranean phage uvMED]
MKLFINTSADPLDSLVQSLTDNSSSELQNLFLGDSLPLRITFTDGSGGYSSWNGETGLSVKVAIGLLATNQTFILEESFIYQYNGYKGNLTLATETLASALDNLDSLDLTFEIQVARNNGETITTLQIPCNIQNQLITTGLVPVDFDLDGYLSNVDPNDFDSNITPLDRDGDGVLNENDSFPDDANETTDSDSDGVGDNSDSFPFDGSISLSQSVLDSYVEDIYKAPSDGDIIKIKQEYTHTKSDGTSNLFSVGEYFLIQEITSTNNIKILVSGVTFYLPFSSRSERWEIVNSLNNLATDPNLDTDGDFKIDSEDYFLNDSNYTQSKSDLDGYSLDTFKPYEVGDIIRMLQIFSQTEYQGTTTADFQIGDYFIITNKGNNWIRFEADNIIYQIFDTSRGTKWEIVNPSDSITADPNIDTDGDSKIDTEDYFSNDANYTQSKSDLDEYSFDTYKAPAIGDIIKIKETLVINSISLDQGSYHIITNVNEGQNVKIVFEGNNLNPNFNSRGTQWEIVNPSDQLTPDNTPTTNFTSGGFTGLYENGKYGYQQGDYDFYNKYAFNGSTYFEVGLGVGTFKDNSTGFEEVVFTNLHEGGAGTYNLVLANGWSISNVYLDNFGQNDPNRSTISAFDLTKTS